MISGATDLQKAVLAEMWSAYTVDSGLSRTMVRERMGREVTEAELEEAERGIRLAMHWHA